MKKYLFGLIFLFCVQVLTAQTPKTSPIQYSNNENKILAPPSSVEPGPTILAAGDYKLTVAHAGADGAKIKSSSSYSVVDIDAFSGDAALRFLNNGVLSWNLRNQPGTDNFEFFEHGGGGQRMIIQNTTGNLGIATANPAEKLEVNGNLRLSNAAGFGSTNVSFYSDRGTANEWRPAFVASGDNGSFTGRLDFFTNGTGFANALGSTLAMSAVNGRVGVGSATASTPDFPLHVTSTASTTSSTTGSFAIGATTGFHLTFDNNEMNAWNNTVGSDLYLNYHSGSTVNVGCSFCLFGGSPANLLVSGYTQLGGLAAPSIKMKKLTGTTAALATTSVAHGLTDTKILAVDVHILGTTGDYYSPNSSYAAGFQYSYKINGANIDLQFVGASLQSQAYRILITYEQ
jgi:hypothetical protein